MTGDGGKTWSTNPAPTLQGALTCLSVKNCYAPGLRSIVHTEDGTKTWSNEPLPKPRNEGPLSVACATTSRCVAAGGNQDTHSGTVVRTTNGGKTWHKEKVAAGPEEFYDVACPSIHRCWAVGGSPFATLPSGYIEASTNGGKTWHIQKSYADKAADGAGLDSVVCLSAEDCIAGGGPISFSTHTLIVSTTDGG